MDPYRQIATDLAYYQVTLIDYEYYKFFFNFYYMIFVFLLFTECNMQYLIRYHCRWIHKPICTEPLPHATS